ncbi:hypothetical protein AiwAL_00760 [Acidiphilium sp. AL]|uniref:hypothetical protein n=1 Tax=Acidiphilium sp. AL TaxID=2871704 RepID=UPI0021CB9733|nr:hypothetical protein [Acidiphilium sp. AL]MCU4158638.1 hypothetical protein [Acidiphilium sp. AL]
MNAATPSARFAGIIEYLCQAVATWGVKGAFASPLLTILLWTRLRHIAVRFKALANAPRRVTPLQRRAAQKREPQPAPASPEIPSPKPVPLSLPRRFGWLLAPVPEARVAASQLRFFFSDPAVAVMIEADPRFGRLLRPLCRAVGLRLPPCLRIVKPARPAAPPLRFQRSLGSPEPCATPPEPPETAGAGSAPARRVPPSIHAPVQPGRAAQPLLYRTLARAPP